MAGCCDPRGCDKFFGRRFAKRTAKRVVGQNVVFAVMRKQFRTYTHPPTAMFAVLERRGMRQSFAQRGAVRQIAGSNAVRARSVAEEPHGPS